MTERTAYQAPLTMRPTTTFEAYCAHHVRGATAPMARGDTPLGTARTGTTQLSELTLEQLERVSRFGVLPSGRSRMKKAVGAGDLLSEVA